jgi:ribosome-binding protein aMBF1 (putative translation factor)
MTRQALQFPTARRHSQPSENKPDEKPAILPTILRMPSESVSQFKTEFITRVRIAREATGWNQREMAEALGIPLKNYESYESRSLLPHYLVARFARVARIPIGYLFTGRLMPREDANSPAVILSHPRKRRA